MKTFFREFAAIHVSMGLILVMLAVALFLFISQPWMDRQAKAHPKGWLMFSWLPIIAVVFLILWSTRFLWHHGH